MTITKRQTKTVTIYLDDWNVLKSITEQVNPPAVMAEAVALLVRMYNEAPEVEDDEQEEILVHNAPIEEREPMEELLEPEYVEPVVETPHVTKPHTEPAQKVIYTDLMSKFLCKGDKS